MTTKTIITQTFHVPNCVCRLEGAPQGDTRDPLCVEWSEISTRHILAMIDDAHARGWGDRYDETHRRIDVEYARVKAEEPGWVHYWEGYRDGLEFADSVVEPE